MFNNERKKNHFLDFQQVENISHDDRLSFCSTCTCMWYMYIVFSFNILINNYDWILVKKYFLQHSCKPSFQKSKRKVSCNVLANNHVRFWVKKIYWQHSCKQLFSCNIVAILLQFSCKQILFAGSCNNLQHSCKLFLQTDLFAAILLQYSSNIAANFSFL